MLDVYGVDSPVPPAVWRRFAGGSPADEVDLILELRERGSGPQLASQLLRLLRHPGRDPDVITVSSFLVVSVTISELLIGVLPLTSWQPLMEKAGGLSNARLRDELADLAAERPLRNREGWEVQDVGRFRWLLARLRDVYGEELSPTLLHSILGEASRYARVSELSPIRTVGVEPRGATRRARVASHREGRRRRARLRGRRERDHVGGRRLRRRPPEHRLHERRRRVARDPQLRRASRGQRDAPGGSDDVRRARRGLHVGDVREARGSPDDFWASPRAGPSRGRPRRAAPRHPRRGHPRPRTNDRTRPALGPPSSACARRCGSSTFGSSTRRAAARSCGSSWRCDSSGG